MTIFHNFAALWTRCTRVEYRPEIPLALAYDGDTVIAEFKGDTADALGKALKDYPFTTLMHSEEIP